MPDGTFTAGSVNKSLSYTAGNNPVFDPNWRRHGKTRRRPDGGEPGDDLGQARLTQLRARRLGAAKKFRLIRKRQRLNAVGQPADKKVGHDSSQRIVYLSRSAPSSPAGPVSSICVDTRGFTTYAR